MGTPSEIVQRHCAEQTVILVVEHEDAESMLRSFPCVERVQRDGSRYTLSGRHADFVTRVIQGLAAHRMHVEEFRTVAPTLEDVFLRLTGHSIRD